jgi:glutaredoxin-like protein
MAWLQEKDAKMVRKELDTLKQPVKLIMFTQEIECSFCRETREVLTEITALSDKLSLEIHTFVLEDDIAKRYGVDKIPATLVTDGQGKDYGLRFYGIPAGYEFVSLLGAIKVVGNNQTELQRKTIETLHTITTPIHIQVFVTPMCPYCPAAVHLAHSLAYHNEYIRADMVEASEFPHLAQKYNVYGVPKVIVNEKNDFEGALPEPLFLENVLKAIQDRPTPEIAKKLK